MNFGLLSFDFYVAWGPTVVICAIRLPGYYEPLFSLGEETIRPLASEWYLSRYPKHR